MSGGRGDGGGVTARRWSLPNDCQARDDPETTFQHRMHETTGYFQLDLRTFSSGVSGNET